MIESEAQALNLGWIVENRYLNHKSSLEIYDLIKQYENVFTGNNGKGYRSSANILLGIAFSLWRAVFLADLKKERSSLLHDTESFLKELIDSNNISFGIDRKYKDWLFRYYMSNANYRLMTLSSKFETQGCPFELIAAPKKRTPQQEWLDNQKSLSNAIEAFHQLLAQAQVRKAFAHVKVVKRKPKTPREL